uniref:Uncharacterized protein n=1 Tax=Phlebotomus papatasi TaxID=29031 RepID=A0A1B0D5U3_PHLPP
MWKISYTNGQHFDCEQPPEVENASSKLSVDDAEDSVSARYTCDPGFELQGEPDLFCDLDTDEWQGQPPICKPGECITLANANNATSAGYNTRGKY